ncbi:MAG: DNA primase [Bacteroidetes bacterium]|nr:DNA primase [Bacteroidota bacterium]
MIPKETIDKIFEESRIEEVIGEFVNLKKSGSNFKGLSPFTEEKSPSFYVSPAKQIFKCFSSGKGGSVVTFLMEHEHFTYPEALKFLAKKYNIEIQEEEQSPEQVQLENEREALYLIHQFAGNLYKENITELQEGRAIGMSYFKERGFTLDTIKKFELGYSPEDRNFLAGRALAKGYKKELLLKSGIILEKGDYLNDRFAARVMFPIHNLSGRIIGFGGRTLKKDKTVPKYVNSPETDIYHKSKVLYGIFQAKKSIIKNDRCLLVEGYTDVISLHQAGVENAVASSGTALTAEQIKLIKRFTENVTVLFDGDAAGIRAAFRGIDMFLEEGLNVKVILFPDGEDPDSFSRKNSPEALQKYLDDATDFIHFKCKVLLDEAGGDPIKKAELIRDIVTSVAKIPDPIKRTVFTQETSRLMDISEQTLINELNKIRAKDFKDQAKKRGETTTTAPVSLAGDEPFFSVPIEEVVVPENKEDLFLKAQENELIRILLQYGHHSIQIDGENEEEINIHIAEFITSALDEDNITFENPVYQAIYNEYKKQLVNNTVPDEKHFLNSQDMEINNAIINLMEFKYELNNWEQHHITVIREDDLLTTAVETAVNRLKLATVQRNIHELQLKIKEQSNDNDIQELMLYNEAKKQLSAILGRN